MHRVVVERSVCDGFRTSKVEAVVNTGGGRKIFVGTGEGAIMLYECKQELSSVGRVYSCKLMETLRKQSKEKKPTTALTCVESWRALIGLVEGIIVAYDSQFYQLLGSIVDNKGCHLYAINENNQLLVAINKKRLSQYIWQYPGFGVRKEINLVDIPKSIAYIGEHVIIGYKKFYECIHMPSGIISRIIDFDKEHKTLILQIPSSHLRGESLLLSLGNQGIILPLDKVIHGDNFSHVYNERKIEWSASPNAISIMKPFLLSVLMDSSIEIHNLSNFLPLQKISIACPSPLSLNITVCQDDSASTSSTPGGGMMNNNNNNNTNNNMYGNDMFNASFAFHAYVCNGEQLSVIKMIPLNTQIEELVQAGLFEEAINLTKLCGVTDTSLNTYGNTNPTSNSNIDLISLYKSSAYVFLQKGDYEKCIQHFILAKCDFLEIMKYFPDFIPQTLQSVWRVNTTTANGTVSTASTATATGTGTSTTTPIIPSGLFGNPLIRAANAVIQLCEYFKNKNATTVIHKVGGYLNSSMNTGNNTLPLDQELQLLDTMYLHALLHSNSVSKKSQILSLLSQPNQCHVESCAFLLASIGGTAYMDALLWLYRSQKQHIRILSMLSEEKCVTSGGWNRDEYYHWTADYLQYLWYQEEEIGLPLQILPILMNIIEQYDAELGLNILLSRPIHKSNYGGKSVALTDLLTRFQRLVPMIHPHHIDLWSYTTATASSMNMMNTSNPFSYQAQKDVVLEKTMKRVIASIPIINGLALGVIYLECLISFPDPLPQMYDEYIEYLFTGIHDLLQSSSSSSSSGGNKSGLSPQFTLPYDGLALQPLKDTPEIKQYKIYRMKIQWFLQQSAIPYHPQLLIRLLQTQDFRYEYALVSSKLGKHSDVLFVCVYILQSLSLAESYCDAIYRHMTTSHPPNTSNNPTNSSTTSGTAVNSMTSTNQAIFPINTMGLFRPGDAYLLLFQVILDDKTGRTSPETRIQTMLSLAEKHFDKFNTNAFLSLLPSTVPVASLLPYLMKVLEYQHTKKRNLQIIEQLLRKREVDLRADQILQSAAGGINSTSTQPVAGTTTASIKK